MYRINNKILFSLLSCIMLVTTSCFLKKKAEESPAFKKEQTLTPEGKIRHDKGRDLFPDEDAKMDNFADKIFKSRKKRIEAQQNMHSNGKPPSVIDRKKERKQIKKEIRGKAKLKKYNKKITLSRQDKKTKRRMKKNYRKSNKERKKERKKRKG